MDSHRLTTLTVWAKNGNASSRVVLECLNEIERLKADVLDTRNAIKLIIGCGRSVPWPDVTDADVDSHVKFIRQQRIAAEAEERSG